MADPVYLTINEFPGTGAPAPTVVDFAFAGGYISPAHVKAELFDPMTYLRTPVTVTDEHFVTDYRLSLPVSVPVGSVLRVYRDTPKDQPLVNFTNGARIAENNLDLVAEQAVFVAAEAADQIAATQIADVLQAADASAANAAAAQTAAAASAASAALSEEAAQDGASVAGAFALAASNSAHAAAASAQDAADEVTVVRTDLATTGVGKGAEMVAFKQAGTGAVDRTASEKLREFVSVKDFGAVGDGVTDDTAAIQAAVNAGESIYFPPGIYVISDQINVLGTVDPINGQYRGKKLFGAGIKATTIKASTASNASFMLHIGNSNWSTDVKWSVQNQLSDMTFDHDGIEDVVTKAAIFVVGAFDTKISNIKVGVPDIPVTKWDLFISSGVYATHIDTLHCKTIQASTPTAGQIVALTLNACSGTFVNLVGCNGVAFNNFIVQGTPAVGYQTNRIQIDQCNNVSFLNGDLEGEGVMFSVSNSSNLWVANNNVAMQGSYTPSGGSPTASVFFSALNVDGILSQNNKFMNWTSGPLGAGAGIYYSNGGGNSRLKIFDFKGNYFTGAAYTRNNSQSIPSSTVTIVDFANQKFDEGSSVTTGPAWKFTAPFRGAYSVDTNVLLENFNIATDGAYIAIFVNGVEQYRRFASSSSPGNSTTLSVSGVILADAGQEIDIRVWSNAAASNIAAAATANFVSIQFQNVY